MLAFAIICTLSGCSKHDISDINPKSENFKCDFLIEDSGLAGTLTVDGSHDVTLVFSKPDAIAGFSMKTENNGVIIEVEGITEKYSSDEIPKDSPILLIKDALSKIPDLTPEDIDGHITVKSQGFYAIISGTGFITELYLNNSVGKISFGNHIELK